MGLVDIVREFRFGTRAAYDFYAACAEHRSERYFHAIASPPSKIYIPYTMGWPEPVRNAYRTYSGHYYDFSDSSSFRLGAYLIRWYGWALLAASEREENGNKHRESWGISNARLGYSLERSLRKLYLRAASERHVAHALGFYHPTTLQYSFDLNERHMALLVRKRRLGAAAHVGALFYRLMHPSYVLLHWDIHMRGERIKKSVEE